MTTQTTEREPRAIKWRKLHGLSSPDPAFAQIDSESSLSVALDLCRSDKLYLCGSLVEMSRDYVEEPLGEGWSFARQYVHKYRSPTYQSRNGRKISVKLVCESWLPGCENMLEAIPAWQALKAEWERATKLPLLSTPRATGLALLWESLPKGEAFPRLPDDLANHIRRNNTQHRQEVFRPDFDLAQSVQYDGRWMYSSLATLDRFPVGEAQQANTFEPYAPGWYHVRATIPRDWAHIGLLGLPDDEAFGGWRYPCEPGEQFETWAMEPELTLALSSGWSIEVIEGWRFQKGRPLANWAKKLIEMREKLSANQYTRAAVREILNHAIGGLHKSGYEREQFIADADWKQWVKENRDLLSTREWERVPGGRMVPVIVPDNSPLSIYMPHWSSTVYALERARVAQHALKCDFASLVRINGDAIYADRELPIADNGNLGQLRRKAVN